MSLTVDGSDRQDALDAVGQLPGLTVTGHPVSTRAAKFDLSFVVEERPGDVDGPAGLRGAVEFRTDLFDRRTARARSPNGSSES